MTKAYPFRCWLYPVHAMFDASGKDICLLPEIREGMARASEFGLTAMELAQIETHFLVPYSDYPEVKSHQSEVEREYYKRFAEMLREFCAGCRKYGLEPYIFDFELSHFSEIGRIYPEALNPNGHLMWDIIAQRLSELFDLFPDLGGIEIYLDEGNALNVSHVGNDMPAKEVIARLILTYLTVCRRYRKKFILCTFTNRACRVKDIQAGLRLVPPTPGFYVNNWMVPGDLGEYLAHNPCIGDVGGHPEIITFDCASELNGQCQTPFCCVDYLKERWTDALTRSKQVIGYNTWVLMSWNYRIAQVPPFVLNTANEVNAYALSRLVEDPQIEEDIIWREWTAKFTDNAEAGSAVTKALKQTRVIGEKAWMLKGFWFMEWPKGQLPEMAFALHSPYKESTAEWDESLRPIEDAIFFPDEGFVSEITADRDEAVALAQQCLDEVKAVSIRLSSPWDKVLKESLERLLVFCRISRYYTELFLRWKLWWLRRAGGEIEKLEQCLNALTALADEVEQEYGPDIWPGNPGRARLFVQEIRTMMTFGQGPLSEWSGFFLSPLAKSYVHSILSALAWLAVSRAAGTVAPSQETETLKQVSRLTRQLLWLKNLSKEGIS